MIIRNTLRTAWGSAPAARQPCIVRFELPPLRQRKFEETAPSLDQLPFEHALRVKSAEFWLKLGEPDQAMIELRRLSRNSRRHPLAIKVQLRVILAARGISDIAAPA
jgi:hypothetical protein